MLNDELVLEFMTRFFGYGNWAAPVWFVGMEEGGGGSETEISWRLAKWAERGKRDLEDLVSYSESVGITEWFGPSAKLQPTWSSLARVLLAYESVSPSRQQLIETLCMRLGNENGGGALLELLPLPSPRANLWHYDKMSALSVLCSRAVYTDALLPKRVAHLHDQMRAHKPKLIVCYGIAYREPWERIAGVSFSLAVEGLQLARSASTVVAVMKHPAARGVSSAYLQRVGEIIAGHTTAT